MKYMRPEMEFVRFTNQDIGNILEISPKSVKDHLKLVYQRLGASSRSEAVATALQEDLIKR